MCTLGLLKTPLVPDSVEPEALDTDDLYEEAGFRDDTTLEDVEGFDGPMTEAIVELAKHPCRSLIIINIADLLFIHIYF